MQYLDIYQCSLLYARTAVIITNVFDRMVIWARFAESLADHWQMIHESLVNHENSFNSLIFICLPKCINIILLETSASFWAIYDWFTTDSWLIFNTFTVICEWFLVICQWFMSDSSAICEWFMTDLQWFLRNSWLFREQFTNDLLSQIICNFFVSDLPLIHSDSQMIWKWFMSNSQVILKWFVAICDWFTNNL